MGVVELLKLVENSSFKARKGEVEGSVLKMGTGKGERFGVSLAGVFFDFGAAGVREFEHAADLVEGFATGIIDGAADELILSVCLD